MAKDKSTVSPSFRPLVDPKHLWGHSVKQREHLENNPRRVAVDLLRLFIANRTPVTLWGPVGARKTRTIEALGGEVDENGVPYQVITLQPSTQDPTIIHGMMYTSREGDTTVMRRSVPRVAEQVMEHANSRGGLTVLFADEMTTCMPSQQNAMLGLLTHGRFEDIDISKHIAIVMAANPEGTVSSVIPLNEAVLNRGGHIAWYGDRDLFVEEWAAGFNGATDKPRPATVRLVNGMFRQAPDEVFRATDNKWSPDSLVPWEMMEHTERAVTEMGRMLELVADVFSDCPPGIADHYAVQVVRALLGPRWAEIAAVAIDQISDAASKMGVIGWVRSVSVRELSAAASLESLAKRHGSPWEPGLRHDQAAQILDELAAGAMADDVFSIDAYLGGWAFLCSAPNEADRAGLALGAARLLDAGRSALAHEFIVKDAVIPTFVPQDVRIFVRDSARAVAQQAAATQAP